ncbi:VOC family protein [Candidatus Dependentiae bacterium]|nr:VOC family protein [Candidatus Dependentiae bacterium]
MKVKNISLAWITTAHLAQAKEFFRDDLGLDVSCDTEDMGWLEFSTPSKEGMMLGVAQMKAEEMHKPGQNAVLTFTVENIEEAKQELESRGVTFVGAICEVPGHVKLASFLDKDKNMFQLVEDLSQS